MKAKKTMFHLLSLGMCAMLACSAAVGLTACGKDKGDSGAYVEKEIGDMLTAKNAYKVVIPDDATATEEYAASEIASYFQQVSGRELQVVKESGLTLAEDSSYISLGDTQIFAEAEKKHGDVDLSKKALNEDGFAIFTYGNNVFINGYNDRGVMYGAFEFIEHTLGVKFLTYDYTHVPTLSKITLNSYDQAYTPAFKQRAYLNTSVFSKKTEYVAHMRFNTDYCIMPESMGGTTAWHDFGNPSHTFPAIVPEDDFKDGTGELKTEYRDAFAHTAADDGSLIPYKATDGKLLDLCYTSGINADGTGNTADTTSAFFLVLESMKQLVLEDEDAEWYMLGQADRPSGCPCQRCKDARVSYEASGLMIRFVNAVNAELQSWIQAEGLDREINLCLFAYDYTERPPLDENGKVLDKTVIPADNVYIKYAPIHSIYYYALNDERQNDQTKGVYEDWAKVTSHLMTWTYATWYAESFWYYPTMQTFSDTMKLLYESGNEYTFVQGLYYEKNIYQQEIDAYVLSKLFWDLDANVTDLRNEFLYYYFGADAYENMVAFHDTIDINYTIIAASNANLVASTSSDFWSNTYWKVQTMNYLVDLFDRSITAVNNNSSLTMDQKEAYVRNLERAKLMPGYMRLYNAKRYGLDEANVTKLASDWVALAEKYGVRKTGEGAQYSLDAVKVKYDL